jgi:thymidine kinase
MSIFLILGPMKSSKSTEMFRRIERYKYAGKKCLILRPEKDNREFLTRSKLEVDKDVDIRYIPNLSSFDKIGIFPDVIGIDEVEFFEDVEYLNKWANKGIEIIACGLNAKADQTPWPSIQKLIPIIDDIYFVKAVCKCGKDASFTYANFDVSNIVIGDKEYEPLCRGCLNDSLESNNTRRNNFI